MNLWIPRNAFDYFHRKIRLKYDVSGSAYFRYDHLYMLDPVYDETQIHVPRKILVKAFFLSKRLDWERKNVMMSIDKKQRLVIKKLCKEVYELAKEIKAYRSKR